MSTGRRKRKTPEQRQHEIRDAACRTALEGGLSQVTTRAIAASLGTAPGLISHYIPSMDDLRAEIFSNIVREELEAIQVKTNATANAVEALVVLTYELFIESQDPTTGIWLDGWSLGRRLEVMAAAVREQMNAWQRFVVALIERGQTEKLFAVENKDAIAWRLVSLIDGLNAHSLVQYRTSHERSRLLAHSIENELHLDHGTLADKLPKPQGDKDEYAE